MVLRSLHTGVTGLRAESDAISVNADNIANVNTVGFKSQRAIFEDQLGRSILAGTATALPGAGVRVSDVQVMHTQGTLSNTGVSTDLALSGDGFFVVSGNHNGVTSDFYSRAGQFNLDSSGMMVNPDGLTVQGYEANADGTFAAALTDVQVPTAAIPPKVTEEISIVANLDSNETVPLATWDPQDPSATSNFSTTITAYDSLGNSHSLDIYFRKTSDNNFDYSVLASGDETTPLAAGLNVEVGSGSLAFDTTGALNTITTTTPVSVDFAGATAGQAIALNFGSSVGGGGTGLDGITQFGSTSNVSAQDQDGYAAGEFAGVSIDGTGVVRGLYTNGEKLAISQLGIAKFVSNDGLGRAGGQLFIQTRDSGEAAMGTAGSGGRAAIVAGSLEASNVDLAEEFVGLIQHQRAYSANSKTITTADDMLQELLNIKR
ncbi:MAG: flagellar hook protein FlgE [Polyangiaceae bacterium]|nr:flagellar hook protein FlgE [Polyangiaceae bacterium]